MRNNLGGLRPGVNWEKEEKKKRLRVLSAGNNYDKAMKSRRLDREKRGRNMDGMAYQLNGSGILPAVAKAMAGSLARRVFLSSGLPAGARRAFYAAGEGWCARLESNQRPRA